MGKNKIQKAELLSINLQNATLVTVVVPVYNADRYLERCLDSILAQTYENIEIILVDDGSTDNSGAICDKYSRQDKRIQAIHQGNMGQSFARNRAIEIAKGDCITFVDSDDKILPDYIQIMLCAVKLFCADIVQTRIKIVNNEYDSTIHNDENIKIQFYQPGKNAVNSMQYKVSPCAKLYCAAVVKNNLFPHYTAYEDDASYYRFAYDAKKVCILDYYTYLYFQTENSVMRSLDDSKDQNTDYISVYYDRLEYFILKNEEELISGTRNRFCLILMLVFSSYKKNGTNEKDMERFLEIFKEQYTLLKGSGITGIVRDVLYRLFYDFPNLTARLIALLRK